MSTFIKERNIDLCFISETWERQNQPLDKLFERLDNYVVVSNPFVRKGAGGKVAVIVNSAKFKVDKPDIAIPWGVEAVITILTPVEVNNSSVVKRIAAVAFYSKPASRKKTVLLDFLAETYHFISAQYSGEIKWIFAGDKNELNISDVLNLSPELKQCVDQPTRLTPPAVIDVVITDLHPWYQRPVCEAALDVDEDAVGAPSDHLMVVMQPVSNFHNKKNRLKKHVEYRPLNELGYNTMGERLKCYSWDNVKSIKAASDQMETFQNELFNMFTESFPLKSKTFFTETQPFYTDKLAKLKRKKQREFYKHRRSKKYLSLHKVYKKELSHAKEVYYDKNVRKLRSSHPRQWFRHLKKLMANDDQEKKLEVEDIKHLPDNEQAELIAAKFAEVANEYDAIDRNKFVIPPFTNEDIPVVKVSEVAKVLESLNTSKATRKEDVPAKIFQYFSKYLAEPITVIINNCIVQGAWPQYLKSEVVTPIPKKPQPKNINELRNITGLLNLNKIMEKVIIPYVIADMKEKLDPSQFGNQPGLSIQHYLIKMLDRIHSAVDDKARNEAMGVLVTYVDWKQAFCRMCPNLGITKFVQNGVRPSLIPIIVSFFEDRSMRVKWRGLLSSSRRLLGGGPMGSSWGIWSYLSQSNDSADMVPVEDRYKFCDDLSVIELINLVNIGIEDYDVRTHVPSNIPVHNQVIRADKLKSQRYIEEISDWTDRNKMVLNVKKTKNMIINFTDKYQFTTDLKLKGQSLEILKEHNLLGTWICDNLKWDLNTDKIVKASNIAMKCLHSAAKFINDRNILKLEANLYDICEKYSGEVCCCLAQFNHTKSNLNT